MYHTDFKRSYLKEDLQCFQIIISRFASVLGASSNLCLKSVAPCVSLLCRKFHSLYYLCPGLSLEGIPPRRSLIEQRSFSSKHKEKPITEQCSFLLCLSMLLFMTSQKFQKLKKSRKNVAHNFKQFLWSTGSLILMWKSDPDGLAFWALLNQHPKAVALIAFDAECHLYFAVIDSRFIALLSSAERMACDRLVWMH